MSKEKKKISIFEKIQLTDMTYAKHTYEKEKLKFKIRLVCTVLAAIGTVCYSIFVKRGLDNPAFLDYLLVTGTLFGWAATLVAGYVIKVFSLVFKCGLFVYYLIPFFFFDLFGFVAGAVFALWIILFYPIVPCLIFLFQSGRNMLEAKEYLNCEEFVEENYDVV